MFWRIFLLMTLLVTVFAQSSKEPTDQCDRRVDVAIIGAGPAGTYAAYLLSNSSLSLELVEGTDRIGGRLHTVRLPGAEDIPIELGTMMFADSHERMRKLIQDLGLTEAEFPEAFGLPEEPLYFLEGKNFKQEDIDSGKNIPYDLNDEEKQNAGRLVRYYYEKLTGQPFDFVPRSVRLELEDRQGKKLYQQTIEEALNKVASPGGKKFFYSVTKLRPSLFRDASALLTFGNEMDYGNGTTMMKIKEGMDSLPKLLVQSFLRDSDRHKLSLNRSLSSIEKLSSNEYMLQLRKTKTERGITFETGSEEILCAKKVILALPKVSLIKIWSPILKNPEISKAIEAVRLVPVSKVIMAFKQQHWTKDPMAKSSTKFTDETIGKIYDLGKSSKSNFYFLMASYAEGEGVRPLEEVNLKGPAISGSAEGVNQVTVGLKDEILKQLKKVFNNPNFEDPQSAISKFWTTMVPVSTVWRANYNFDDTICRLQRPSLNDDIHIVGSDYAWGNTQSWTEGALESVENVLSRYFTSDDF